MGFGISGCPGANLASCTVCNHRCKRLLAAHSKAVATKTEGLSAIILIGNVGSKKCQS